jgi:hypothetical protein
MRMLKKINAITPIDGDLMQNQNDQLHTPIIR